MEFRQKIDEASRAVTSRTDIRPTVGIVLGSGLGELADLVTDATVIEYRDIPHFAVPSVELHKGELVVGRLEDVDVVLMRGRFHYYEGLDLADVTFPMYVLNAIGVDNVVITNACGAINESYAPADLMLINDHINISGLNPLRGPNDASLGPRFPEMSAAYCARLRDTAQAVAADNGISVQEGVYAWWCGPSLETPAEIRMLRALGADVVGMSTVPEATVATYLGMDVLGVACVGNMASGMTDVAITAEDVAATVRQSADSLSTLIRGVLHKL